MSIALRTIIMEGRKKMENKLQPSQPGALQAQTPNTTFNLPGNNNTLVAHTDAVNNTYSVMMVGGAPPMPGSPSNLASSSNGYNR